MFILKLMQRCPTPLVTREKQSKPQSDTNSRQKITNADEDVEKLERSYIAGGMETDTATWKNSLAVLQKVEDRDTT